MFSTCVQSTPVADSLPVLQIDLRQTLEELQVVDVKGEDEQAGKRQDLSFLDEDLRKAYESGAQPVVIVPTDRPNPMHGER